jgi:hypothetical protein
MVQRFDSYTRSDRSVLLGVLQRRIVGLLLRRLERLLVCQPRILQQQREHNQRNTQADTDDAKYSLDFLVRVIDGVPVGRSYGIGDDPSVWRAVDLGRERCVASYGLFNFLRQLLRPDCTGYAAAEC